MTSDLYFIINVFNVIIISIDNFICALLYAIEWVYRLLSLNPEYNHNQNHNLLVVGSMLYEPFQLVALPTTRALIVLPRY